MASHFVVRRLGARSILPRLGALAISLGFCLLLQGCVVHQLEVQIRGLDSYAVQGLHFWRLDEASGQWVDQGRLVFEGLEPLGEGHEKLTAMQYSAEGEPGFAQTMVVIRDGANPDDVTVAVRWARVGEPGWFRVSSWNAAGESELSDERAML